MSDANFTFIDTGLGSELAIRVARQTSGTVRIYTPWESKFPKVEDRMVNQGLDEEGLHWVEDGLAPEVFDDTDIYVFPDILYSGLQLLLERAGKAVWGSRTGDRLETNRLAFRVMQADLGLPTPEYTALVGITELRAFLKDHGPCWIKMNPTIRGVRETWKHESWEDSEFTLDALAVELGAAKEVTIFLAEEPIEARAETGFDGPCVDGRFPERPIQGIEVKDKCILCSTQLRSKTPDFIDEAMRALSPVLKEARYRNFLSAEFRDGKLIDPCCRIAIPGIDCQMEMISNIGDMIEGGARGTFIEPEYDFDYGFQVAVFHKYAPAETKQFRIPEEVRRWFKLAGFCKLKDGLYVSLPRGKADNIGWLVGVGKSIEEAAGHVVENAEALKDHPFEISVDAMAEAVAQARELEEKGVEFADQPIPEPEEIAQEVK